MSRTGETPSSAREGYSAGLESGDLLFLSYVCSHRSIARFLLGDPLERVLEDCQHLQALMEENSRASAAATQILVKQTVFCLLGRTRGPASLSDDTFDETEFVDSIERAGMSFAVYWYLTAKGGLSYLNEDPTSALKTLARAADMAALAFTPETLYLTALSILALADSATREETKQRGTLLERCIADLERWAHDCPANYSHKHLLVLAQRAQRKGDSQLATRLYEQAIAAAREHDWPRDLALTNELCAKFHAAQGRGDLARAHCAHARDAYERWGAVIHVRRLDEWRSPR